MVLERLHNGRHQDCVVVAFRYMTAADKRHGVVGKFLQMFDHQVPPSRDAKQFATKVIAVIFATPTVDIGQCIQRGRSIKKSIRE
jgi:hypothetical protein